MKKHAWRICIWLALAALLLTACGQQSESDLPGETDIYLEGYETEDYSTTHPEDYRLADSGFAFIGNGGTLTIEGQTSTTCTYWLEAGQTLEDVADFTEVTKEGAAFTGWTLYQAQEIYWGDEAISDEDLMCMVFDPEIPGKGYIMLRTPQLLNQSITTEDLLQITCSGQSYLAVANWE